jgi:hypothetical protein
MKEFQKAFSIMLVIISCGEILNSSLFGKAEKIAYLFDPDLLGLCLHTGAVK